jgi:hypothetical protein
VLERNGLLANNGGVAGQLLARNSAGQGPKPGSECEVVHQRGKTSNRIWEFIGSLQESFLIDSDYERNINPNNIR